MDLESTRAHEALWTFVTLERPFPRMSPFMIRKVALRRETLITTRMITDVRLFPRVNALMSLKVPLFCKSFIASLDRADERLFSRMSSDVYFKSA